MEGREENEVIRQAWRRHERRWRDNLYVYAVVSRRSGGISIGLNVNPDKACNFDCAYCQVNRREPPAVRKVDLQMLAWELDRVLEAHRDGSLFEMPPFDALPSDRRDVRDIAFSGDGEPTTFPRFEEAVRIAADGRSRFELNSTKIVLITDGAYLAKPAVRRALAVMDQSNGEIWAKLDAGTEEYFKTVNRPNVTLERVLENILDAARVRPVVIQSLFCRVRGEAPPQREIETYCERLIGLLQGGGRLSMIQVYTIARDPSESFITPLTDAELDRIAWLVRSRVAVPVEVHYGVVTNRMQCDSVSEIP
jgi:wyosine [tRNA(Phe)-imidazoG37] synthetase (radical SAM superfamily)